MSRSNVIFIFIISLSLGLSFIHAQSGNTEKPIQVISSFSGAYSNKKEAPSTYLILKKRINLDPLIQDNNILRFVSKTTPLKDKSYTPNDLLPIAGSGIDEAGRTGYLRYEARISIGDMSKDFEANFHTPLVIISGYRSATYQQRMWDLGKCTDSLCAPPGHSEHQLGLAVDLFDASTKSEYLSSPMYRSYVEWFRSYAHLYGWTESYTRGEVLDEYEAEPWHWRYVGREMATRLKKLGWNYTEYIQFQQAIQSRI